MIDKFEAVKRMQGYISKHYTEDISMAMLAEISSYSPWYSYRIFLELTNYTPADYIRRLRLSQSALELRDNNVKIIEVAFKYGYQSVDGYQRAFYKEFGKNPYDYCHNPTPIYLFTPYLIYKKEEKIVENVKNVFISVVNKKERKVLIKRGVKADNYMDYCYEVGCDIWGLLKSMDNEPVSLYLPKKYIQPKTSSYVQGVEVDTDYKGVIPDGFDTIILPECTYLQFQGEPFAEEDYCEAIEQIKESAKKFNPETLGYVWDKDNPVIQLEPIGTRGYIELYPIKRK